FRSIAAWAHNFTDQRRTFFRCQLRGAGPPDLDAARKSVIFDGVAAYAGIFIINGAIVAYANASRRLVTCYGISSVLQGNTDSGVSDYVIADRIVAAARVGSGLNAGQHAINVVTFNNGTVPGNRYSDIIFPADGETLQRYVVAVNIYYAACGSSAIGPYDPGACSPEE